MLKCLFANYEYYKGIFKQKKVIWDQKHPIFLLKNIIKGTDQFYSIVTFCVGLIHQKPPHHFCTVFL